MDEEKTIEILMELKSLVSGISVEMKAVNEKLLHHEQRITELENVTMKSSKMTKDDIMALLVKGLIASVFVIGSLTGAGSLLKEIFVK